MKLAESMLEVTSPHDILSASESAARERLGRVLERHQDRLVPLGLLEPLKAVCRSSPVFAPFMLVHSPFEFLLEQLEESGKQNKEQDNLYFGERLKLLCVAPLWASGISFPMSFEKECFPQPAPVNYTNLILDLRHYPGEKFELKPPAFDFEERICLLRSPPNPSPYLCLNPSDYYCYSSKKGNLYLFAEIARGESAHEIEWEGKLFDEIVDGIERAKGLLRDYEPGLLEEVEFFVRGFVIDFSASGWSYGSLMFLPGLIYMAPQFLLSEKNREWIPLEKENALLGILVAAQIIHESSHQKHYFINRCEDTTPQSGYQTSFVRPEFKEIPLTCLWTDPPHTRYFLAFFSLSISVGSELHFLEHALLTQKLGRKEREVLQMKIRRKRRYLLSLLVQGELAQDYFSPEGKVLLERLFQEYQYKSGV